MQICINYCTEMQSFTDLKNILQTNFHEQLHNLMTGKFLLYGHNLNRVTHFTKICDGWDGRDLYYITRLRKIVMVNNSWSIDTSQNDHK